MVLSTNVAYNFQLQIGLLLFGQSNNVKRCHCQVGMPCGTFILNEDSSRPLVLISGGVGLTPMVSMLDHVRAKVSGASISRVYHDKLIGFFSTT